MPSTLTRFGASIEADLLGRFDELVRRKGYETRSEVLRNLMRDYLVANEWELDDKQAIGTITLVFDHHSGELSERLTEIQHAYHDSILSALHVHLDAHTCLEVIIVRGRGCTLQEVADRLITAKGVLHGKLVITSVSA